MNKEEFYKDLLEIKTDKLFITDRTDLLEKEIETNCWSISVPPELSEVIGNEELIQFLADVKINRIEQLNQANANIDLIYYLWHDEMAGQLRFNFINKNHKELPFKASIETADSEKLVIRKYLVDLKESKGYEKNDSEFNGNESDFKLEVYKEYLKRK